MVNIFKILEALVNWAVKLAGLTPKLVEIEPGTVLNIWVPTETLKNTTKVAQKPVVVLLHSFAANGILTWFFQAISLSGTYSVYVPDFIFFGDSVTDKLDRTSNFQAECLAKGLQKLGVKKCTIVGLSYGGMVGFNLARNYPDLVESMVVTGTVMEMTESIMAAGMAKFGGESWSDLLMPESIDGVKEMMTVGTHKLPWLPNIFYKHSLEAMFDNRKEKNELLKALVVRDKDAAAPNYTQRIHLLWGEDDKIFNSEFAENIKRKLGDNASLEYMENAGHLAPLERPFVYTQQLKKVLASFHTQLKQE
ncbi:monoacylglycerol lipase ABHD6 [Heracleum sosnowskyi]|uniref:Monoacylglycerol lipase ABHD6 n=1 Tax=Heracleum sosnowskyi TaxID=360622 RepID=A0AAD8H1D8_9APIA|nr:monoacylglycerol lipase ABHD6 [Heracleum sosnowskyi]